MCLITFAWQAHPALAFVALANRDEFFDRPTAPAHWWDDATDDDARVYGGRDLKAMGSWLLLARSGRFAALTNYRDPHQNVSADARSRGQLVLDAARATQPVVPTLARLRASATGGADFNLLSHDGTTLAVLEQRSGALHTLDPGVYGLSNALLDTPWPKLVRTRNALAGLLDPIANDDTKAALTLMRDDRIADDAQLPDTGVNRDWERWLSASFVRAPGYGTRCTTLVVQWHDGRCAHHEWRWDRNGAPAGETHEHWHRSD